VADESPKGVDPRIHRFAESAQQGPSGLLCLTCGSTAVDQRSRSELACAACGTAVPWEGEKFAVLRYVVLTEGAIDDALEVLRRTRPGVRGDRGFMTYERLLQAALATEAVTRRKLPMERHLKALDVLLRLPSFCGGSPTPDDDWFPWWCYTQYCAVGHSAASLFDLWQRGFYVEATVLLRRVLEVFIQVRYFHGHRSELRPHLTSKTRKERVLFKTMFETFAPGYYHHHYGEMLSGVAHGGLPSTTMRLDLSKGQQATVIPDTTYNERLATWVLNQLTPVLFGLLKLFPEFFPQYSDLVDTESSQARIASLQRLSEVMSSHRQGQRQSAPWYESIEKLVCWSGTE
jgi:hypothetical protein